MRSVYGQLLDYLFENSLVKRSMLSSQEVCIFYSTEHDFFILPNGSLFLSESLLEAVIEESGLSGIAYLICHELAHLIKGHLRTNLSKLHAYGDLRR